MKTPEIRSMCIMRMSALGDVTHCLPLIHTIQTHWPEVKITWVIGKLEHKLMQGLPGVRFIVFDKSQGWRAFRQLRRDLADERFDALLHMQVAFRANLASLCVKADIKVGYDPARSKDLHGLFVNRRIRAHHGQHVLDCLHSFLAPIGLPEAAEQVIWKMPLTDSDYEFARAHIDTTRKTLCISPVSSHKRRNWTAERYAAIADHAIRQHDMQVILSGGPSQLERDTGDAISAHMKLSDSAQFSNLIGKDTLKQSAAFLECVDLLLAPDTGPMHIANAMGTDVLGLHAASNPVRSGAYSNLEWSVDRYDDAARKFRGKPADELPWGTKLEFENVMDLVTLEDVRTRLDCWIEAKKNQDKS